MTYLAVEKLINSTWEVIYVDTDWSTTFRWKDAGFPKQSSTDDRNVITALFDIITQSLGVRFNYAKALELYESGRFRVPESLHNIIDGSGQIQRRYVVGRTCLIRSLLFLVATGPAADHPLVTGPAADHPLLAGPAADHPLVVGPAADHPLVAGPAADHPLVAGPAADHPLVVGPAADHPLVVGPWISWC